MKKYMWKITNHQSNKSFVVWWDGKKVCSNDKGGMMSISGLSNGFVSIDDGEKWIKNLGMFFTTGYSSAKRLPDDTESDDG